MIAYIVHPNFRYNSFSQTLFRRLGSDWVPKNTFLLAPLFVVYRFEQYNLEDIVKIASPDVTHALSSFAHSYWLTNILLVKSSKTFDSVIVTVESLNCKFPALYFLLLYIPVFFTLTLVIYSFVSLVISRLLPFTFIRAFNQLYKTTVSILSNFEFTFFLFSSLSLYILVVLLSADDIFEQVSDLLLSNYVILFTLLIVYLTVLYSVHILTFIALSAYSKCSLVIITRQFKNDILDLASLLMRFYVLLFRLNVYDLLEDLFDGYYIFLGDFGDEYLLDGTLVPTAFLDGFSLSTGEENCDFEDTNPNLWFDIFKLYYFV